MAAPPAPVRLRRTWPQRLLIFFNILCIMAALTTAVGLTYVKQSVGEIPRIRLGATLRSAGQVAAGKPQNYLIVGVDSAAGLDPNDPVKNGRQDLGSTLRSDTIMVLHIDPRSTRASILSFPRDLWVPIAGTSHSGRINTAITTVDPNDGPRRLIQTITEGFQIPIDHYLQVDFAQFKGIVHAVGGVPVYFQTPVRDTNSGLAVPKAGCITLDGAQALAYVRSRHYEIPYRNGWREDPATDLGRISRQQDFIRRMIRRAISKGSRNPAKLKSLMDTGVKSITLDDTLKIGQLTDLGLRFRGFNPDNLKTYSLGEAVVRKFHGGADALDLVQEKADPILRRFQSVSGRALPVSAVKVQVLNGSGVPNQATTVTQSLVGLGFQTAIPGSAPANSAQTVVRYPAGHEKQAQLLARFIGGPVRFEQAASVTDVQLVTGTDFTSVLQTAKPAKEVPAPTTSAPLSSTTSSRSATTPTAPRTTTTVLGIVPATPAHVNCG